MPLRIHNSLSKQKEEFKPLHPNEVKMYVCGPTVYDEPHIGHLRSAYAFEVMRNYLKYAGYKVTFVRNVTDVDDKIIERAVKDGVGVNEVSEKYFKLYKEDLKKLGISEPDHEPRATGNIPEMLKLIEALIQKGAAYESGGDVYFSVNAFAGYGKLSHQNKEMMQQNVRIDKNEKKRDVLDFALWKKAKEGEPSWLSPWGSGRPGWHIECSAMSMKDLGETFDIHGGGRDLIFPHHENEIAQSEAATGKPFARYWLHHGLVTIEGQKMSKSLGNYVTLQAVENKSKYGAEELKFLFLGTHYSMPLDYSDQKMEMEKSIRERFVNFFDGLSSLSHSEERSDEESQNKIFTEFKAVFQEAMNDDFNTPKALAVMHEMITYANKSADALVRLKIGKEIRKIGHLFGLEFGRDLKIAFNLKIKVNEMIDQRQEYKRKKEYKLADEIRDKLLKEYKIELLDSKDGATSWRSLE